MEALWAHGLEINYLKIREAVGMGGDNFLPKVAHLDDDSPEGKAIGETRGDVLKSKYLPYLRAFPQVKELLTRLHGDGLKLVVATSAKPEEARALLQLTGASEIISEIATTEDAEHSKPAPDILQACPGHSPSCLEKIQPVRQLRCHARRHALRCRSRPKSERPNHRRPLRRLDRPGFERR